MEEYENGLKIEEETHEIEPKSVHGNDVPDLEYKYPEENEDIYVTTELAVKENEMRSDKEVGKDVIYISGTEETEENRLLPSSDANMGVLSDIGADHGENVQVNKDFVDDDPSTGIETENRDATQLLQTLASNNNGQLGKVAADCSNFLDVQTTDQLDDWWNKVC